MIRSEILGVATHVPDNIVTNNDLEKMMETNDEWITKRTGIRERRWAEPSLATSDLGLFASQEVLKKTQTAKEDIDMIILCTLSPDHDFPGTACFLQKKLGIPNIPALDVRQQCSGFLYGLSIADQFIKNGMYKTILLVGAEIHSHGLDKTTRGRDVSVLFGDGAGAVVVKAKEVSDAAGDSYVYSTHLHADGSFAEELWLPAFGTGVSTERVTADMIEKGLHYPQMNGKKVFVHAVEKMSTCLIEALDANKLSVNDIDCFLFHQANMRINEAVADKLGIPGEKVFNTIQKFGNTTAATIPIGMDYACQAGKLKKGDLVASAAFGSGFTWASAVFRY